MKAWLQRWRPALGAVAVAAVVLSLVNASWIAPTPSGHLSLVANRGVGQSYDRSRPEDGCAATRIAPAADNPYIENTLPSIYKALKIGAQAVSLPVQRTRDGRMVVFADASLDCRTNGHGAVGEHSLAEIKALDAGYGYTPDGGGSFPLRGRGIGAIPTVEEVLSYVPTAEILFSLDGNKPADADALAGAFARAGVPVDSRYGFVAEGAVAARLRGALKGAWVYGTGSGRDCLADYGRIGWSSFVPASCRNTTIVLPIADRWKIWGWPYRFLDRMAKAHSQVVIYGARRRGRLVGLEQPEQYDQVPANFHGHLVVEDIWTMGPSLRR